MNDIRTNNSSSLIRNFRPAAGLASRIFRCGHTDRLAQIFANSNNKESTSSFDHVHDTHSPEYILLNRVGLILDLRSPAERNETDAKRWMSLANGPFQIHEYDRYASTPNKEFSDKDQCRKVYRIDVLSSRRLFDYISLNWLSSSKEKELFWNYYILDADKLHQLHMDVLNERGLVGLYEAILATGQKELCFALKMITQYIEGLQENRLSNTHNLDAIAVHCVHGKDRTGILIMLLQSIVGLNDEDIIEDYHLSHIKPSGKNRTHRKENLFQTRQNITKLGVEANKNPSWTSHKLDHGTFLVAPRHIMRQTLSHIRKKYGSVCPGYLDHIDFGCKWRRRLAESLVCRQPMISLKINSNL